MCVCVSYGWGVVGHIRKINLAALSEVNLSRKSMKGLSVIVQVQV